MSKVITLEKSGNSWKVVSNNEDEDKTNSIKIHLIEFGELEPDGDGDSTLKMCRSTVIVK